MAAAKSKAVKIDTAGKVDPANAKKAAAALLKWYGDEAKKSGGNQLFEDDQEMFSIQITLRKIPDKKRHKPIMIPLPHSLFDPETGVRLCLFVKDPVAEVADKLAERPVPGFAEVMGYSRLSKDFKQYKSRRELLKSYDGFFVDDRILPMMPRVLGKVFYARKKQPWPVPMGGARSLENALAKVRDCTPLYLGAGMCVAVKVGTTGMTAGQVAENIQAVVTAAVDAVPKKWRNIAGISLKLPSSLSLPLYAALPAAEAAAALQATQGAAQAGHGAAQEEEAEGAGSDFEQGVVWEEEAAPAPVKSRGTKRARGKAASKPAVKATRSTSAVVGDTTARRSKRKAGGDRFFSGK